MTHNPSKAPPKPVRLKWYEEGARAKEAGKSWADCPYTDPLRSAYWHRGWDMTVEKRK